MAKKVYGEPLTVPPFQGRIQKSYNDPLFLQAISRCHQLLREPESRILLDRRNRVARVTLSLESGKRTEVVIKEFHGFGVNKLKSLIFPSKAHKAWLGASALEEREIGTPFSIAYFEKRKRGFLEESFFWAEWLGGVEEVRSLFSNLQHSQLRELVAALARFLFFCHEKGILHRDLSDGNILVKKEAPGNFNFYLIDTNRIRLRKKIGRFRRINNLVRLGIPAQFQPFFLEQYLGYFHSRSALRFWYNWYKLNKKRYSWFVRFKKKLHLRQLAKKLKIE